MTAGDGKPCKRCGTSEWYADGHCKRCKKEWYERNKESALKRSRLWSKNNPEKVRRSYEKWRRNNPEDARARKRRYYHRNKERSRANNRRWFKENKEKNRIRSARRRARELNAGGGFTADEFKRLCEKYGNRCLCCGRDDVELTADHVIPLAWDEATNDISNIQPLCKICNSAKGDRHATDYRKRGTIKTWKQLKLFHEAGDCGSVPPLRRPEELQP